MVKFKAIYICEYCKVELTKNETYESDGCCPYCGNLSNEIVVNHTKSCKKIKNRKLKFLKLLDKLLETTRNFYSKED